MADLTEVQAAGITKVIGSDASGQEQTPVQSTSAGGLHSNLRDNAGAETGVVANPLRTDPTGTTTQPVSAVALPLPAGAATSANQTTEITSLQVIDDIPHAQNAALSKGVPTMGQLDDTSTTAASEDAVAVARITPQRALHTNLRNQAGTEVGTAAAPVRTDPTGTTTQPVSVVSLPLPTGAATEATLAKLPVAQGSTTSGESGPLAQGAVTTAAPSYTTGQTNPLSLTPAGALRTDASATIQPVSAVSLPLPTGAATEATLTKLPVAQGSTTSGESGPLAQGAVTTAAPSYTTGQTNPLSLTPAGALRTDASATTQPVSAVSLPLPTGAATSANQTTEITSLQLIDDIPHAQNAALSKGVPMMGQLDDTSTTAATEDNVAVARITAQRAVHINIRNNAGTELGTTAAPVKTQDSDGTDLGLITTNGDRKVVDGLRNGGVYGALNIPTANTPVEAKVGASRLTNRKFLQIVIENNGIYYGLDNTVTTTTGLPTANGQVLTWAIDPDSSFQIWLVGNANNKNVHIMETP